MSVSELFNLSLLALLVMGLATLSMRLGGFWLMGHVPLTPRVRRMLEALPGSIVVAIVLPIIVKSGLAAVLAIATAAVLMVVSGNALVAVAAGMLMAVLVRGVN